MTNKISKKTYWDNYYQDKDINQIPWSGSHPKFFEDIWEKYKLPKVGNVLDVGCGRGDKSFFLTEKGYSVWAFDLSEKAIEIAKETAKNMANRPIFFQADATHLDEVEEIKDTKFDIILDKLSSQFLNAEEKNKYLDSLNRHIKQGKTFYVLQCFGKDKLSQQQFDDLPDWIKKIAVTSKEVEEIYGKYFSMLGSNQRAGIDNREVDTYIMSSKE